MTMNPRWAGKAAADLRGPARGCGEGGFTLLELLISITLLAFILVITLGAVRMGSRSLAAGERRAEAQERFRTVMSIMDAQLQSQMPLGRETVSGKRYYFNGEAKSLRFLTSHSIWSGQRGYVVVDYVIEREEGGREVLQARERTPGIDDPLQVRLIESSGMSFMYFYRDPAEEEGIWTDTLPGQMAIPQRVRFDFMVGGSRHSREFPIRVHPEMTAVQARGGAAR
jgi:prepilin-type N-terminal cleavage/methylation domain-containing protein